MVAAECGFDLCDRVSDGRAWSDPSGSEPVVARKRLEQRDGAGEEVRYFLRWLVVAVAGRVECRNALVESLVSCVRPHCYGMGVNHCAVLAPLMLPEALWRSAVRHPVGQHVIY